MRLKPTTSGFKGSFTEQYFVSCDLWYVLFRPKITKPVCAILNERKEFRSPTRTSSEKKINISDENRILQDLPTQEDGVNTKHLYELSSR